METEKLKHGLKGLCRDFEEREVHDYMHTLEEKDYYRLARLAIEVVEALERQLAETQIYLHNTKLSHQHLFQEKEALAAEVQALRGQVRVMTIPAISSDVIAQAFKDWCVTSATLTDGFGAGFRAGYAYRLTVPSTSTLERPEAVTPSTGQPGQAQCKACGTESVFVPGHGQHRFCLCRAPADQQEGGQENSDV